MSKDPLVMQMFGRPGGVLGRIGGIIMALTKRRVFTEMIDLLDVGPNDEVLEIGFGPGVAIRKLAEHISAGHIRGIDPSTEMIEQATRRNAGSIQRGLVELGRGCAEVLPFGDNSFDRVLAVNSLQVWRNPGAGLQEVRRVLKPAARVVLGFTKASGQMEAGMADSLIAAGFTNVSVVNRERWFCVLGSKS